MNLTSYIENNTFCILLMLIILKCHCENLDKRRNTRTFTALLASMILYTGFDFVCGVCENTTGIFPLWFIKIFNLGFFYSAYTVTYLSFMYAEFETDSQWINSRTKRILSGIPLAVNLLVTPFSLKWKFFFYINDAGKYIKGQYYWIMLIMMYGYLLVIAAKAFYMMPQKKYFHIIPKLMTMASFVVFPFIAGILQVLFPGVSIICIGGTLAIVQVFINLQKMRITMDPLTQINNRTRLLQYLDKTIKNYRETGDKKIYFLMIDMDKFKDINDSFGHIEGDRALVATANAMKYAGKGMHCLLSRYGGDEFAVVLESDKNGTQKDMFLKKFHGTLNKYSNEIWGYNIEASVGIAEYNCNITNIKDFINIADMDLYDKKNKEVH